MRVFLFLTAVFAALAIGCGDASRPDQHAEWQQVEEHGQAAESPEATPNHRQRYADSVRAFVEKHPTHGRAREVWHRIQLEFADDLMGLGRPHEAVRFYRSVLAHDPDNERASRGWEAAAAKLVVTRAKLAEIEPGMTGREVAAILGRPLPGWKIEQARRSVDFEAWYYRTSTGGLAGVYFREGKVIATETASNERTSRSNS